MILIIYLGNYKLQIFFKDFIKVNFLLNDHGPEVELIFPSWK